LTLEKLSQSPTFTAALTRVSALEASRATLASPVFTGTVTADNLVVNGGITDGATFGLYYDPTNPIILFDASDSFGYARGTNLYGFNIGGLTICSITTTALTHTAKVTAPLLAAGDDNFNLAVVGSNAICTFDTGDAYYYNRTANAFQWQIASTAIMTLFGNKLNVALATLPIYADNTAATTGGLNPGDIYRTSTGQWMVRY